ncbi:MAG: FadR/GntR family transcriptional regulator [Mobilicoccus sp.]|nr:FadR/GntR family transcriptional regulator [Mobilicoccus sp.]
MARERLVQQTVDQLLDRIVDGDYEPGRPLPAQPVLATELNVSRLTVREAIETLRSRRIVKVLHGSGTFVNPPEEWGDIDAISRIVGKENAGEKMSQQVLEVRRMVEIGAAELCAARRTDADLEALDGYVRTMRDAHAEVDVDAFVTADIAFHAVILDGCGNPFLAVVYDPLMRVLRRTRTETSSLAEIREHAIAHHEAIAEAIRSGDAQRSGEAMRAHMQQTGDDLGHYVHGAG